MPCHLISPNNPVRRRLVFDDNVDDEARNDNFANIVQETIAKEREAMTEKYNFDFSNETAFKGRHLWYKNVGGYWTEMDHKDYNSLTQRKNENTPARVKRNSVPEARKRNSEVEIECNSSVKRKLEFKRV